MGSFTTISIPYAGDLLMQTTPQEITTLSLYVALELGGNKYLFGANTEIAAPMRKVTIKSEGAQSTLPQIRSAIAEAKKRLRLPADAPVHVVYEAGWEGFWLARALRGDGFHVEVVDAASIKVDRRAKRAKTDRLDLRELLVLLHRHVRGEKVWRTVNVPSEEIEDQRRLTRRREALVKEQTSHTNRIKGLLNGQGIKLANTRVSDSYLETLTRYDGRPLGTVLVSELQDEFARLRLVREQLARIKKQLEQSLKLPKPEIKTVEVAQLLHTLKGIGPIGAFVLSNEFFWREFRNRKQVGSLAGLVDMPWKSDGIDRQQGISKAGNRRVRTLMVEMAWGWLRWQPESDLSKWFNTHTGVGKRRMRKIAIVALARKLLVALWRYTETGVAPGGAVFRDEKKQKAVA